MKNDNEIDLDDPNLIKAIKSKEKLRQKSLVSSQSLKQPLKEQNSRVPNGQYVAKKWIVLDLGLPLPSEFYNPWKNPENWTLTITGEIKKPRILSLDDLRNLGVEKMRTDFHCVTGWTALDVQFTGIPFKKLLNFIEPKESWSCLYQISADKYTVPVERKDVEDESAFLILGDENGTILPKEHGGIRIFFPKLYGWKSAKYLTEIQFLNDYTEGFWEQHGCHRRGRVQEEERWKAEAAEEWEKNIRITNLYRRYCGERIYVKIMQLGGRWVGDTKFNDGKETAKWQARFKLIARVLFIVFVICLLLKFVL